MIRYMVAADHLPDYSLAEEAGDILRVSRREVVVLAQAGQGGRS